MTEPATGSYIFNADVTAHDVYVSGFPESSYDVSQENVVVNDNTDSSLEGSYTGTISGVLTEITESLSREGDSSGEEVEILTLHAVGGILALNFNNFYSENDPPMTMTYDVINSSNTTIFSGELVSDVGEQIYREEPVGLFIPADHSEYYDGTQIVDDCGTVAELVVTMKVSDETVATISYAIGSIIIS